MDKSTLPTEFLLPDYDGGSIANIPATIAAPAQHGLVGLHLFFPEYGTIAQMLSLSPDLRYYPDALIRAGLEPQTFLHWPALGQQVTGAEMPVPWLEFRLDND